MKNEPYESHPNRKSLSHPTYLPHKDDSTSNVQYLHSNIVYNSSISQLRQFQWEMETSDCPYINSTKMIYLSYFKNNLLSWSRFKMKIPCIFSSCKTTHPFPHRMILLDVSSYLSLHPCIWPHRARGGVGTHWSYTEMGLLEEEHRGASTEGRDSKQRRPLDGGPARFLWSCWWVRWH